MIILTDLIKGQNIRCIRIILFGSYAKGNAVIYDEYYEDGILKTKQSDYDILVVAENFLNKNKIRAMTRILRDKVTVKYDEIFKDRRHAPPRFVIESEKNLTNNLLRNQVFFTEIISSGIVLYDNAKNDLPEPQELSFRAIKSIAQKHFDQRISRADHFLKHAHISYQDGEYIDGAFELHQACEHYYNAIGMVFDNKSPKEHDLKELINGIKGHSSEIEPIFQTLTAFDKEAFELLWLAYSHARYDLKFTVAKEQYEYMLRGTDKLKELTIRLCEARLKYYDEKISETLDETLS